MSQNELQRVAHLIGAIFHAGCFKAETANERELETLLARNGYRYQSWDEVIAGRDRTEAAQAVAPDTSDAAVAEQLVEDWDSQGRMPQMAWDFRGFAQDAIRRSRQAVAPGGEMCAKGQAFKDYVHQRLDAMGVPHSVPESEHDKAGCRIGGRLDFVEARIAPGGGDESTQPHPRWKVGRGDRHPQTADEWNWREDGPENGGGLARSVKRLNVAMDYDDPRAPDQMALVLRVDLMRVQQALVWRTAQSDSFRERLAAAPASEAKEQCCEHAGTFLCHCGKFTLIEKPSK